MKKIGVFSDIHIPTRSKDFPVELVKKYIKDIDIIFGLGDFVSNEGLDYLYQFNKEVFAVQGNMDEDNLKLHLPIKQTVFVEEIKIGLIHGWGSHFGIRDRIIKEFDDVDLICYGHTHSTFWGKHNNKYFFNPGAMCGDYKSFGILIIENKIIEPKFIQI